MTLLDLIRIKHIRQHAQAERVAAKLVESWHKGELSGELADVLGLSKREYQAWTTGGVSLLTIAHWRQTQYPKLDSKKPWFKLHGKPGQEHVGYLNEKKAASPKAAPSRKLRAAKP